MKNISEGILDFKSLEKKVFDMTMQIGREAIQDWLSILDKELMALRDTVKYRAVNSETTTIKTTLGEIAYTRRRYRMKSGGYVFLLDKVLGIEKGCGLVSENLAEQIIAESADKSFRKASESIGNLTGQRISAMGVWGVLQRFGEKLGKQEKRLEELYQGGVDGQLGKLACQVMFSEFDDVWLPMQRTKRLKKGEPAEAGRKRSGKKPIHVGTAYTGWSPANIGKFNLLDKFAYARFGSSSEFATAFGMLLHHRYDMDGVVRWVMNGDGASWIKAVADINNAILQLDPFHRSRAIMKAVTHKADQKTLTDAIKDKEVSKALTLISDLIAKAPDEQSRKKLGDLFSYFHSNKDTLLTWRERGLELPKPPEGVVYRDLGTQESSNCDLITQRMKHRKGSWSENGANNMAKILCLRSTIGLDMAHGFLPDPPPPVESVRPLSAAESPLYDGKGYDGSWLFAPMPYDQTYYTHGRDAIRGLLKRKPLTERSFL